MGILEQIGRGVVAQEILALVAKLPSPIVDYPQTNGHGCLWCCMAWSDELGNAHPATDCLCSLATRALTETGKEQA